MTKLDMSLKIAQQAGVDDVVAVRIVPAKLDASLGGARRRRGQVTPTPWQDQKGDGL